MQTIRCDVVVVGAGPAGSGIALLLARQGLDVRLLDRERFPRDKVCGDFLSPGAVELLDRVFGAMPALLLSGAALLPRAEVVPRNGQAFGAALHAMSCPRSVTDSVLLDAAREAGARFTSEFNVRDVDGNGQRVTGIVGRYRTGEETAYRAGLVIGADGTRSLVARALGLVRPLPKLHRIALRTYYAGGMANPPAVTMHLAADELEACCGIGPPCGPAGRRNVNIVVPVSEAAAIAGNRRGYFEQTLARSFPTAAASLESAAIDADVATIGCYGHSVRSAVAGGAMLVGDAAAFVDPFTGEGVHHSLRGAQLAAGVAISALAAGGADIARLREYDRLRRRELAPRYALCDMVRRVVRSPGLLAAASARLRASDELAQAIFRATGDIDRPRDLLTLRNIGLALGVIS